jgi:hypothetical protein
MLESLDSSLWFELLQRGPSAFAAQVVALSDRLSGEDREETLSGALASVLRRLVRTRSAVSGASSWIHALQKMSSRLPTLGALLQLFSVAVRYVETQDESVLLELPLEQRRLLLDEIGEAS